MGRVIAIEGPVSVGKTAFISKIVKHCTKKNISIKVLHELFSKNLMSKVKTNVTHINMFFFAHRVQMQIDAHEIAKNYDLVLLERSTVGHMTFNEAFLKTNRMDREYVNWLVSIEKELKPKLPDTIIYLDLDPIINGKRIKERGFAHDKVFDLEFLKCQRESHYKILKKIQDRADVIVFDWKDFDKNINYDTLINRIK